jgi:hypothetical protein
MKMVRDVEAIERLPYLARLGLDPNDAGRLAVAEGIADRTTLYVNAETGESRFVTGGDPIPDGIWIAQREVDNLKPRDAVEVSPAGHGFGEGRGTQSEQ